LLSEKSGQDKKVISLEAAIASRDKARKEAEKQAKQNLELAQKENREKDNALTKLEKALDTERGALRDAMAANNKSSEKLDKLNRALSDAEKQQSKTLAELTRSNDNVKTMENDLAKARAANDQYQEKLEVQDGALNDRTRERDILENQLASLQDQINRLTTQHSDLTQAHNGLQLDSKNNEKEWLERLANYRTLEAELRAHIKKLEQMVSKELRHARHGLLSRIDDMEATLAEEKLNTDRKENPLTIVDKKAS